MQTLGRSVPAHWNKSGMPWSSGDTPGTQSPARASRLHPKAGKGCGTNTSSFSDLFHLITSCDFLGTVHRNEQAAASGHNQMVFKAFSSVLLLTDGKATGSPSRRGSPIICPKSPHRSFQPPIYYLASSFCPHPAKYARGKEGSRNIKAEMPLYTCLACLAMTN